MLAVVPLCAVPLTAWWDGIASLPSGAVFPLQAQTIGDQVWRVGLNALADEQLVDLDVALDGCVAAGNGCHVLTCLVRLVLDVALHFGVAAVLLEPRVIADNVDCLCVGESEDAGELHC